MGRLLFYLAIICSMLSQVFLLFNVESLANLLKLSWLLPLVYFFFASSKKIVFRDFKPYILFIAFFAFYCFACESTSGVKYVGADLKNIAISFMVMFTSYLYAKQGLGIREKRRLALAVMMGSLTLAFTSYNYFLAGYDLDTTLYALESKNSVAQILFASILACALLFWPRAAVMKIPYGIVILFMLYVLFLTKSRATILCVFLIIAYFIFVYRNKTVRIIFLVAVIASVTFVLSNEAVYHTVVENILFANRDSSDLDDLSSGRLSLLAGYWKMFWDHPVTGCGNLYYDCFPIAVLIQYGMIGGMIVFPFILSMMFKSFRMLRDSDSIHILASLLMLSFLLNSLFEAQPPFGPGIKCFILWMFWGFVLAGSSENNNAIPYYSEYDDNIKN